MLGKVTWRMGLNSIHALGTWSLLRDPWFEWADVVHLHNLHGEAFSYLALPALAKRKPLVWTLHDMWAITGHCAFSLGCDRWRTGCGRCPHLEIYPYAARDATRWEWRWKYRAIRTARPLLVAPSRWLGRLADEAFPELAPARHVPYSIDTAAFRPVPPPEARAALGLPPDRMLLLSAASDLAEARKGGHLLAEALRQLPDAVLLRTALVTLGDGAGPWLADLRARGMTVTALGYIDNPAKQALVYSAADLLLFPSMDDNLPIVVLEALACGLPALAFAVGGVPELIATPAKGQTIPAFEVTAYAGALGDVIGSWRTVPAQRASLLPRSSEPMEEALAFRVIYGKVLEVRATAL